MITTDTSPRKTPCPSHWRGTWKTLCSLMALLFVLFMGASSALTGQTLGCEPSCRVTSLTMNTGIDHQAQQLYNVGGADGYWKIVQDPQGKPVPRCANVIYESPDWYPAGGSRWLGPNPTASVNTPGIYIYEWCFCVCSPGTFNFNMFVGCDDEGEVYLDGILIGTVGNFGATWPTPIATSRFLGIGNHCIQVRVNNQGQVYSGMNLEGTITAGSGDAALSKMTCCPGPIECGISPTDKCHTAVVSLNTGVDHSSSDLYDIGDGDAYWHITEDPQTGAVVPRCAYVIEKSPDWYTPSFSSRWIGPNVTASVPTNGIYAYEICFCVETPGIYNIDMAVGCDDRGDVFLDGGTLLGTIPNYGASTPTLISVPVFLSAGTHCIQVRVENVWGVYSGLNVVGAVSSTGLGFGLLRHDCCDNKLDCTELCRTGSLSMNTGVNHETGVKYAFGNNDPYWQVIQDPQGKPTPRCANVLKKAADWYTTPTGTQWIGPNPTTAAEMPGVYIFQLCFCVETAGTYDINLNVGIDDHGSVVLDGNVLDVISNYGADAPNPVTTSMFLTAGTHCLQIHANNSGGRYVGINVSGTISSSSGTGLFQHRCCDNSMTCFDPCEADYYPLSTGYDQRISSAFDIGSLDPFWEVVADAGGGFVERCANVIDKASSWDPAEPNSQWIGTTETANNTVNGLYSYRRCFCVAEAGPVTIDIIVRADDQATIKLDGVTIGTNPPFGAINPTHIVHNVTLAAGKHCLQIDVTNTGGGYSGLNVSGGVTGDGLQHFGCCSDFRPDCLIYGTMMGGGDGELSEAPTPSDPVAGEAMVRAVPNPTSGVTTIHYVVETESMVTLDLYNTAGEQVGTLLRERKGAGAYSVSYDAKPLPAGTYYLRLTSGDKVLTVPMNVQ